MTTCSVSPERHATVLYSSPNALDWTLEGIVLDHQNKDMLIFEGLIEGHYWAETRPLGDLFFAYPPGSEWCAGPPATSRAPSSTLSSMYLWTRSNCAQIGRAHV